MRLLLVTDVDPAMVIGGGERLVVGHASGFAARGHEVVVCSGASGEPGARRDVAIVRVGRSPATRRRIEDAISSLRPDVVIGYQPACALFALGAARRRGIPGLYVFSSCWADEYRTRRSRPTRIGARSRLLAERSCLRRADRVVVLSEYSAGRVANAHPGLRLEVRLVPGGVDPRRFAPRGSRRDARIRIGAPARRPLLVTVRNLVPRTGVDSLLQAMPRIAAAAPRALLIVGGDGPLRPSLERQACDLGVADRVSFAGYIPDEALPDHYSAADLAILPTRALEGFGLFTLEALACGTPVLGTPVGATPEILRPLDPGLIADDATPEAIAAGVIRALSRTSPRFARRARRHVLENYTWESSARRLEAIIEEVAR